MIQRAEKSLSSFYLWVIRLLVNFLCCSSSICKCFCQISWQCNCELLFPVPSGALLTWKQWDEFLILLFLLSSLGNTITQQQWYNLFAYVFENIAYKKASKNALQICQRHRFRKFLRRRRARLVRNRKIEKFNSVARQELANCFNSTLGFPGEGWGTLMKGSLLSFCKMATRILLIILCCAIQPSKTQNQHSRPHNCTLLPTIPLGINTVKKQRSATTTSPFRNRPLRNFISQQTWPHRCCQLPQAHVQLHPETSQQFNSTLGYPGEGWTPLKMATWNTRSLTYERYKYCESLGYDVLAITELWRNQQKYQTKSTKYTASAPKTIAKGPRKGQVRFPKDKAAGVGILLSSRAQKKLMGFGSEGERVCWVRLKGPTCNIFLVAVYIPHRGRTQPSQEDTIKDLRTILAKIPRGDCICILGDFNEQLKSAIPNRTGKWTAAPKSQNADKILELMHMHELTAANTLFEPRHQSALYTFLQSERDGMREHGDMGEYVGRKTKVKCKDTWITGTVKSVHNIDGEQEWLVCNSNDTVHRYNRKHLEKILVRTAKRKVGKQLDYILVSTRWKSCIRSCRTRWGPSMHRDLHGEKNDHALLECVWNWRIRTEKHAHVKTSHVYTRRNAISMGTPKRQNT